MTSPNSEPPGVDDYRCWIDFPDGWLNITTESLSPADAELIARQALNCFNPLLLRVDRGDLVREITRAAVTSKKEHSSLTAAYYTDAGEYLALLQVNVFGEDGVKVTPAEVQPLLLEKKGGKLAGEPEVDYLDHPLGPSVRVRSTFKGKNVFGFGQRLTEHLTYAVCPTVIDDVLVVSTRWEDFARGDELTESVDSFIRSLRLITCDSEGNPIETEPK